MSANPSPKAVDAALHYADFARGAAAIAAAVWRRKYPAPAPGDALIDLQEHETRPDKCMQILAAEVRRLQALVAIGQKIRDDMRYADDDQGLGAQWDALCRPHGSTLSPQELHVLQHSLGLARSKVSYRNYFCTGPGADDFATCEALVAKGLMTRRRNPLNEMSDDYIFHVTEEGKLAASNDQAQTPSGKENDGT